MKLAQAKGRAWWVVLLGLVFMYSGCRKPVASEAQPAASAGGHGEWFEDITVRSGLDFKHDSGASGSYFMPESTGSGGAFLDFDNDGLLDIYLIHNVAQDSRSKNALYRQEPGGTFRNVSAGSGLDVTGYGMGVAVGDVDNDGKVDVLLTEYDNARLFWNLGQGRFEDISRAAGLENTRWGTSAAFFDYDRDGWLDLVIANYVDYSETVKCYDTRGALEYCGPQSMLGTATRLFHNLGAAPGRPVRFEDVSVASGLALKIGPALGVLCADFDRDGWPDIFMADDGMPNRLYINQRDGRFTEEGVLRGIALNAFGATVANMGVALGDVDGDGWWDVFVTHLDWEQHSLWKQGPPGLFQDQTAEAGLGHMERRGTGFGTVLADFDRDGALDLVWVNGRIKRGDEPGPYFPGMDPFWIPYAQRHQIFANDGTGRFQEISDLNPALCGRAAVGRGLAWGDVDNDGAPDLLVCHAGAPAQLLRNVAPGRAHWVSFRAIDPALGGRDAYGAEITVRAGSRRWWRLIQPASSFLVSNDPRAHFGLGKAAQLDGIEVRWPDGVTEQFPGGPVDRVVVLRKGEGTRP